METDLKDVFQDVLGLPLNWVWQHLDHMGSVEMTTLPQEVFTHEGRACPAGLHGEAPGSVRRRREPGDKAGRSLPCGLLGAGKARQGQQV